MKARLDAELHYNVGFNAGPAAGQTVMHLHVHVIPRYRGDMDDPRGGVRHFIPSRGNYLRQVAPLATGGEGDPFARHVLPLFDQAAEACIVAAFVQESGLARVRRLDWQRAYAGNDGEEDTLAGCFTARVIVVTRSFHPKSWRFESPTFGVAFVGSSNLSLGAGHRHRVEPPRRPAQAITHRTEAAVRRTTPSRRSRSLLPHTEAAPSSRPRLAPR